MEDSTRESHIGILKESIQEIKYRIRYKVGVSAMMAGVGAFDAISHGGLLRDLIGPDQAFSPANIGIIATTFAASAYLLFSTRRDRGNKGSFEAELRKLERQSEGP